MNFRKNTRAWQTAGMSDIQTVAGKRAKFEHAGRPDPQLQCGL